MVPLFFNMNLFVHNSGFEFTFKRTNKQFSYIKIQIISLVHLHSLKMINNTYRYEYIDDVSIDSELICSICNKPFNEGHVKWAKHASQRNEAHFI